MLEFLSFISPIHFCKCNIQKTLNFFFFLQVSLHMPNRIPRPSEVFFHVGLESLVSASVLPTMSYTSTDVKSFDPDVRNCYFAKERKLRYYKGYSQNNCNMECNTNYTRKTCGCVAYYMPSKLKFHL